jgi:hypothetical protein
MAYAWEMKRRRGTDEPVDYAAKLSQQLSDWQDKDKKQKIATAKLKAEAKKRIASGAIKATGGIALALLTGGASTPSAIASAIAGGAGGAYEAAQGKADMTHADKYGEQREEGKLEKIGSYVSQAAPMLVSGGALAAEKLGEKGAQAAANAGTSAVMNNMQSAGGKLAMINASPMTAALAEKAPTVMASKLAAAAPSIGKEALSKAAAAAVSQTANKVGTDMGLKISDNMKEKAKSYITKKIQDGGVSQFVNRAAKVAEKGAHGYIEGKFSEDYMGADKGTGWKMGLADAAGELGINANEWQQGKLAEMKAKKNYDMIKGKDYKEMESSGDPKMLAKALSMQEQDDKQEAAAAVAESKAQEKAESKKERQEHKKKMEDAAAVKNDLLAAKIAALQAGKAPKISTLFPHLTEKEVKDRTRMAQIYGLSSDPQAMQEFISSGKEAWDATHHYQSNKTNNPFKKLFNKVSGENPNGKWVKDEYITLPDGRIVKKPKKVSAPQSSAGFGR